MQELLTLRSSIKPSLMLKALLRGFVWALLGAIILIFSGAKLSVETLSHWGLPLFATGIACITFGLLPYRRLLRLELKPNELVVVGDDHLEWWEKGRKLLSIPLDAIENMTWLDEGAKYGISLQIREHPTRKLIIHDPKMKMPSLPLFMPYFSKRTCEELKDEIFRRNS